MASRIARLAIQVGGDARGHGVIVPGIHLESSLCGVLTCCAETGGWLASIFFTCGKVGQQVVFYGIISIHIISLTVNFSLGGSAFPFQKRAVRSNRQAESRTGAVWAGCAPSSRVWKTSKGKWLIGLILQ
ncbi:MAG: hypothetical protein ANABAC_3003 [Anaerolineae bacterium]|nr:MAG: hypothetical protein ANABAC_3003 [Anaerolineae bacterium]